jgi:CRISPR-associated protein Cmr1
MKPLRLHVELTTPTFLGGANPECVCEWRAASVRGQLRWWFRAVAGGRFQGDLKEVRKAEIEVFGSTDRGSALRVRISGEGVPRKPEEAAGWGSAVSSKQLGAVWRAGHGAENPDETRKRLDLRYPVNPVGYLAGMGCLVYEKELRDLKLKRRCFEAGNQAELTLRLRPGRTLPTPAREFLDKAIWAWLHLGGLGARSRRGFGSLAVTGSTGGNGFQPATTREELLSGVRSLLELGKGSTGLAEWSHLSSRTRVCVAKGSFKKWDEAMVDAGGWMMAFRRRYGISEEKNEQRDYHWAKEAKYNKDPKGVPDRAGFGLPLPFGKLDKEIVGWGPQGSDHRRASPLLLHIAKIEEGDDAAVRFLPVFTHLPARLVPAGEKVRFQGLAEPASSPTPQQTGIVTRFLDDLIAKDLLETVEP